MGNMRFKVGDRVRIKSLDWYNKHKNEVGTVICGNLCLGSINKHFCGKIFTIKEVRDDYYIVIEDMSYWNDEMIEGLVEDETKPNIIEEAKTYWDSIKDAWICPDGYIFKDENGNVVNAQKIVLEKKKKEYPKTYEECLSVLQIKGYDIVTYVPSWTAYEKALYQKVLKLRELIICRDAYWKIAGDEMGLGKPWEPDWVNLEQNKHCIWVDVGDIILNEGYRCQHILTFPTEEMRDAFYENFKELINECKELL